MIHETVHDLGPPPPAPSPPRSAGRREILPQPLNPAMAAEVIRQFQQVMQQFLQTQQSVMHDLIRAYCGGAGMDATPPIPEAPATRGSATVAPAPNGSAAIRAALPAAIESRVQRHEGASAPPAANGETAHGPNGVAPLAPHREPDRPPEPRVAEARHVPAPAEAAPASRRPVATSDRPRLQRRLLEIVSDRTGYPVEMLPPDADLEADLGIDSIKRVEIAGTIVRELEWPPDAPPDLERLTGSRTLRQVVDQLEAMLGSAVGSVPEGGHERPFDEGRGDHPIGRFVLRPIFAPPVIRRAGLAPAGVVLIVDDRIGVGERLAARLAARGHRAVRIVPGTGDADADGSSIVADVGRPEGVSRLVEQFHRSHGPAAALVHLAALGPGAGAIGMDPARWRARLAGDLESLFLLAQALRPDLERAAAAGGAALLGATALGGAFAADGLCPDFFAGHGATAGLLKTLAHEWPTIRVKAVDVGPAAPGSIADDLMGELMADDGIVEVGYRDGRRTVLRVADAPVGADAAAPPLDGDSVVLITGGARGITAEAAIKLAATYRPRLLLVGRTPPPSGPEPSETAGMADPRSLRQAILDRRRREGRPIAPAAVEDEYRRLVREREVRLNLDRLRRTGARVEYLTCDVRDADAFAALIERIYRTGSRIDGVIHGAGIIEDRLLRDKDLDSFRRVLETKVNGAIVLAGALRPESLRFLVFFGSVSGRFGNRGQADYAAANEVLNKLAQHLDQRWPARVVSINWGPWLTSGMVSAEVRRQFAERGVALIPVEEGCRRLEEELRLGRKGDVEVLIGGAGAPEREAEVMPNSSAPSPSQVDAGQGNEVADRPMPLLAASTILTRSRDGVDLVRTLDLRLDRYLDDHRIDGRPVLPLAMAMEFMAEAASAGWPGYEVIGLRDVRLMRGVILDGESTAIRLTARPTAAAPASTGTESGLMLDVTIAPVEDPRSVHYRASVDLMRVARGERDGRGPSPAPDLPALDAAGPFPMSLEEAYRDWLFHGPLFRGLASLDAIGPGGARARSWPSSPGACLGGEPRGAWLIDPVVLDCAFQVQVLWARLHWDVTLLPTMVRSYRRLAPAPEGAAHGGARLGRASDPPGGIPGIRLEMRIRDDSRAPLCHADHHVFDHEGRPLAIVTGAEAAGSRALNRLTLGARR